jgi:NADPH2:quinone reductase
MHAIRLHEFGPAENLRFEEVPDLQPEPDQLRVEVEASGVHLVDTTIRLGVAGGPFPVPDLPMVPGREVAGTVDAVGADVDPGWLGRRVVAHLGLASGGYAEQAVVRAASVHEIPPGLSAAAAVAMIGTGRTALVVLDVAELTADDVVLVTAAAGGIGSLLVQAARHAGATVVGLAGGPAKRQRVAQLGVDVAVDYLRPSWPADVADALGGSTPTVLLDGVGGAAGRAALDLVGVAGRVVFFGWSSGEPTPITTEDLYSRGITATAAIGPRMFRRYPNGFRELEARALTEAATGRWVPVLADPFPLARAADAHVALERRATVGKVVLVA